MRHGVIQHDQRHIERIQSNRLTDHVHGVMRGDADEARLAVFFQSLQGFQRTLGMCLFCRIHGVVVQNIHVIHLQPPQALLGVFDEACLAVRGAELSIMVADGFLGGNGHLIANTHFLDDLPNHLLIATLLIPGGGVIEAYAQFVRAPQQARDVGVHHPHAHNRKRQACLAERALQDRT